VDEIISTRRLVDIVNAYAIFGDKDKAMNMCLARFDDDTREAFMSLYGKIDGDSCLPSEEESAVSESEKCPF